MAMIRRTAVVTRKWIFRSTVMSRINNLICMMHSGMGPNTAKEPLELPSHVFVAFYAPPGRSLGTAYGNALFAKLTEPSAFPTMEALQGWHKELRSKIFQKPIKGNTDPSTLELYPDLNFQDWPQITGRNSVPKGEKPWNYFMFGPKESDASKDNFGLRFNSRGLKYTPKGPTDVLMLQEVVDLVETDRSNVNGPDVVIHFLGCREEAKTDSSSGGDLGNLFIEVQQTISSRQQIRLQDTQMV
jgi:hypothetical protein